MSPSEKKIFELLSPDSLIHIDEIVEQSNLSVSEVLSLLLRLEINELVLQMPGKCFQRRL